RYSSQRKNLEIFIPTLFFSRNATCHHMKVWLEGVGLQELAAGTRKFKGMLKRLVRWRSAIEPILSVSAIIIFSPLAPQRQKEFLFSNG
ncbi:MAG: hypothetical protein AAFQ95_17120, partial [Cyanobacteria bacterium J06621_3]